MTVWQRAPLHLRAPRPWPYLVLALLVSVALLSALFIQREHLLESERTRAAAERSYARREEQAVLLLRLRDAEAAQRGFLLTGNGDFLRSYRHIRTSIAECLAAPSMPFGEAPAIAALVAARIDLLDRAVALEQGGRHAQAAAAVARDEGRQMMRQLQHLVDTARRQEAADNNAARRESRKQRVRLDRSILAAAVGSTLFLSVLYVLWQRRRFRHAGIMAEIEAVARHTTILESTIDAILIVSPAGRIEMMNAAACRMLDYDAEAARALAIEQVIDPAPGTGSFADRIGLKDGELAHGFLTDQIAHGRGGQAIPVDVALGVLPLPSGDHLLISLRDISERKRVENAKDELVSTVTHELRTPLTSVVGSLGLLRAGTTGTLPPAAARLVEIAENNSRRLIRLINDMLDIDGIASGKLHIDRQPIDLRGIVEQACMGSEGLAESRDVQLRCTLPATPVMVSGDSDRLVQVVGNLLSNAVRVSSAAHPVEVSVVQEECGAIVHVDDRGPGIPLAFRDRIFGRFERAAPHDGTVGTGLGLAISREIIERHDGRIWFEDRPGGGTRFAFSLAGTAAPETPMGEERRVLVCTADAATAADLTALAREAGCGADIVADAAAAMAIAGPDSHVAAMIDLDLPGSGGGLALARDLLARRDMAAERLLLLWFRGEWPAEDVAPFATVDCREQRTPVAAALRAALSGCAPVRPVLLHLDDDRDLLAVVATAMGQDIRVLSASDLPSARAILGQTTPDVAILDPGLPEGSGLDLLPLLVDAEGATIPTIVYSAQELPPEVAGSIDAVLVKARGSLPDLEAEVRRLLKRNKAGAG